MYLNKQNDVVSDFVRSESVENIAELILFELGFKSNLQGTKFLADAIVRKYNTKVSSMCKQLYPQIGEKFGTTGERVERCIRHAINVCYISGNLLKVNEMSGCKIVGSYPPTNSEFISSVCTWIHLERTCGQAAGK